MKPVIMWAIYDPSGELIADTIDYSRSDSVGHYLGWVSGTWKERYYEGFRAMRVKIEPVVRSQCAGQDEKP